ncbi:MAG TPA: nicotinate-nucleotide adenylyltransferase [Chloroflexota bacterium]|nr:nicotinate-nucleotide adenylyltransferase [Chloroflexota bacterium]
MIRLGLLGGTFDPPHYGHLLAAQEVAWRLHIDRVLFLPARQNPLKRGEPSSSAEDRCEMVALAVADNPIFELSRLDLDRPPPSYTADLLRALQSPEHELFFLVGADILPELPKWREPQQIVQLARLVVVNRPGAPSPDMERVEAVLPGVRERVDRVQIPGVDVSSREIRKRVAAGRPIRYLTPPAVERYIIDRRLYRH